MANSFRSNRRLAPAANVSPIKIRKPNENKRNQSSSDLSGFTGFFRFRCSPITVWLEVRVLPGASISDPRDFATKASVSAAYSMRAFAIRSPGGGIWRVRGLVSGRKNSVPGAVMASREVPTPRARASRIAGTIRPARLANWLIQQQWPAGARCYLVSNT